MPGPVRQGRAPLPGNLAIRREILGEDHPDTATSYNNLAANLRPRGSTPRPSRCTACPGDPAKALGEDHPDTATSYNNLAVNLEPRGSTPRPSRCTAGPGDPAQGPGRGPPRHRHQLQQPGREPPCQGKYAEAEPLHRSALAIRRKALGEDHPDTATGYNNLAANLNAQGKYAEAEPLYRRALAIRLKALGEDHPDTATSYNNLAANLHAQGKYAEAEPLHRRPWRSAARPWARTTPTPPPATTTWPRTSVTRGSTPRPRRCTAGPGDPPQGPGRGPPRHRHQLQQPGREPGCPGEVRRGRAAVPPCPGDPAQGPGRGPPRHRHQLQQPGRDPLNPNTVRQVITTDSAKVFVGVGWPRCGTFLGELRHLPLTTRGLILLRRGSVRSWAISSNSKRYHCSSSAGVDLALWRPPLQDLETARE